MTEQYSKVHSLRGEWLCKIHDRHYVLGEQEQALESCKSTSTTDQGDFWYVYLHSEVDHTSIICTVLVPQGTLTNEEYLNSWGNFQVMCVHIERCTKCRAHKKTKSIYTHVLTFRLFVHIQKYTIGGHNIIVVVPPVYIKNPKVLATSEVTFRVCVFTRRGTPNVGTILLQWCPQGISRNQEHLQLLISGYMCVHIKVHFMQAQCYCSGAPWDISETQKALQLLKWLLGYDECLDRRDTPYFIVVVPPGYIKHQEPNSILSLKVLRSPREILLQLNRDTP